MSEPKFTRGPWQWYGNTKHDFYLATTHSGRLHVMGFQRKGMRAAQPVFRDENSRMVAASDVPIFEVGRDATDASDERVYRHDIVGFRAPDAHLIAAAPELYEALQAFVTFHSGHAMADGSLKVAMQNARAALAKARGETP